MNERSILITGAAGLIGRALSAVLISRGWTVRGFGLGEQYYRHQQSLDALADTGSFTYVMGSVLDDRALCESMRGCLAVVHLAAMAGLRKTEANRLRCLDINVRGTDRVLSACIAEGVTHIVNISSAAVYGDAVTLPVGEDEPTKPKSVYALSKVVSEELTRAYCEAYPALRYTVARLFTVYGAKGSATALDSFVATVCDGRAPVVYGDGSQVRCFTHVSDVAAALGAMPGNSSACGKIYNIGNPAQRFLLRELAQRVVAVLAPNRGIEVEMRPAQPGAAHLEIMNSVADISRASVDLGYCPSVDIDEGIRRVAAEITVRATL